MTLQGPVQKCYHPFSVILLLTTNRCENEGHKNIATQWWRSRWLTLVVLHEKAEELVEAKCSLGRDRPLSCRPVRPVRPISSLRSHLPPLIPLVATAGDHDFVTYSSVSDYLMTKYDYLPSVIAVGWTGLSTDSSPRSYYKA